MQTLRQRIHTLLDQQTLWRFLLAVSILAILFLATTSDDYPVPASSSDKVNHLIAFVELTILARLSWPGLRLGWLALPLLAFGLAIELIQSQLPYRDFALGDLIADASGIALRLLPWPGLNRRYRGRPDQPFSD